MIRWAADRPAVAWALAVGILMAGVMAFTKLPLATRATIELPEISVSASWQGSSPELVETWVTSPIEAAVQGVRGVRGTSSSSQQGIANIRVKLDPDADLAMTRLAILERIEALRPDLPLAARRSVGVSNYVPDDQREQSLVMVSVTGGMTPGALATIARDQIEPRLSGLAGVAKVLASTQVQNGIAISYDPLRLKQVGIDPNLISSAVSSAHVLTVLGKVNDGLTVSPVVLKDIPSTIADLAALPIAGPGGRIFSVGDLTSIYPEEDAGGNFYRLNGRTAFTLSIYRLPGADAIRTADLIRTTLDSIRPTLPPSVRMRVVSDQSTDLANNLNDLMLRGLIAFGAVLLVLLLGTRNLGGSFVILGSTAVAIAGTALGLYLLDIPANMLTLAGLAMGIGILVQNGLVIVERLQNVPNTAEARATAARKIAPAVVGSTLTTIIVLVPFLYLQDNARAAFIPFAAAFALALFWSIGTALVLVPAVSRSGKATKRWPILSRVNRFIVRGLMRWRLASQVLTVAVLAVLTWGFINKVPRNNWGNYGNGALRTTITASVAFPRGTDPKQVEDIVGQLETTALTLPGVAMVTASGGTMSGSINVQFTPETSFGEEPWIASDELTKRAVLIGGATNVSVSKPEGTGFYGGSNSSQMFSQRIKILGYSFEGVRQIAQDLKNRLAMNNRIPEAGININAGSSWGGAPMTTVVLTPDRRALGRVGATVSDYQNSIIREMSVPAGGGTTLQMGSASLAVDVKSRGADTRELEQLRLGSVSAPDGPQMRIADVSTLEEVPELPNIQRENQRYIRILTYDFRGSAKMADRIHKAFMKSISVPAGFEVSDDDRGWGGDQSTKDLTLVFALGIVLVLLSVSTVFNSIWTSAMVFLSLPIALGGVVAAYWMTGTGFTREATVGVILVVGLAVNHSILLIDGVLAARTRTGRVTAAGVYRATLDRTEMIVLVTLTTIASLVPMAWGEATSSLSGSIALATVGGTLASTIGAMYLMPPILLGWTGFRRRRKKKPIALEELPMPRDLS